MILITYVLYMYNVKEGISFIFFFFFETIGFIIESEIFRTGVTGDLSFKFI